ncbi:MAG TPA: DUF1835 domain-containing protein, partial [Pyrinomonadaceae bacterium]|nr:DUF1835 domain-containing protein [Pyrinomonadaceae bacterium]
MLHILNGGSTEALLAQTSVAGSRFSFKDVLIAGPAPAVNDSEWRRVRVDYLAKAYGIEFDDCEADLLRQEEVFASSSEHDEVTLWFESDLFCQANLLYVLDWFAHKDVATRLSLICIGEFPGRPNFRGLGELNPPELASLFDQRIPVSPEQLELATRGWQAFRSPDPRALERLTQTETDVLPFLNGALRLQLARFPSTRNGLNLIESKALQLIDNGFVRFGDLFPRFIDAEPLYGFGDWQFWHLLQGLTRGETPLLTGGNADANQELSDPELPHQPFAITDAGRAVLKGAADFIDLNGIDTWLGGVHLQGQADIWRWDEDRQK